MADENETESATDAAIERTVHEALAGAHTGKPDFAAIIAKWVNEEIMNTPASADTAGFNHLTGTALPALIKRLEAA